MARVSLRYRDRNDLGYSFLTGDHGPPRRQYMLPLEVVRTLALVAATERKKGLFAVAGR